MSSVVFRLCCQFCCQPKLDQQAWKAQKRYLTKAKRQTKRAWIWKRDFSRSRPFSVIHWGCFFLRIPLFSYSLAIRNTQRTALVKLLLRSIIFIRWSLVFHDDEKPDLEPHQVRLRTVARRSTIWERKYLKYQFDSILHFFYLIYHIFS